MSSAHPTLRRSVPQNAKAYKARFVGRIFLNYDYVSLHDNQRKTSELWQRFTEQRMLVQR